MGATVEEALKLLRELEKLGVKPKQYDLVSPWERRGELYRRMRTAPARPARDGKGER